MVVIAGAGYLHGEGLEVLSGGRKRQLQVAVETACALVEKDVAEIKDKVRYLGPPPDSKMPYY